MQRGYDMLLGDSIAAHSKMLDDDLCNPFLITTIQRLTSKRSCGIKHHPVLLALRETA